MLLHCREIGILFFAYLLLAFGRTEVKFYGEIVTHTYYRECARETIAKGYL